MTVLAPENKLRKEK